MEILLKTQYFNYYFSFYYNTVNGPIKDICVIWYETLLTPKKIMKKKNF